MNEKSSCRRRRPAEPPRSLRAEQRPHNHCAKSRMNRQLADGVKQAQAHMEEYPGQCQPSSPLLSHEKTYPADGAHEFRQLDPHRIGMPRPQLRKMSDESNYPYQQVEGRNHNHRPWSLVLVHRHSVCSPFQSAQSLSTALFSGSQDTPAPSGIRGSSGETCFHPPAEVAFRQNARPWRQSVSGCPGHLV